MKELLEFLGSPTGLGYVALIVVMVMLWIAKRKTKWAKIMPYVVAAFNGVEKLIPNNAEPGSDKWVDKLDLFLRKFVEAYRSKTGKEPTADLKELAKLAVETLVFKKNSGNGGE